MVENIFLLLLDTQAYAFSRVIIAEYYFRTCPEWIRSLFVNIFLGQIWPKNHGLTIAIFSNFWLILKKMFWVLLCILLGYYSMILMPEQSYVDWKPFWDNYFGLVWTKNHGLTIRRFSKFWLILKEMFWVLLCVLLGYYRMILMPEQS